MSKFIVMVQIDIGWDSIDGEYTGIEWLDIDNARMELKTAKDDPKVSNAWIKEVEG